MATNDSMSTLGQKQYFSFKEINTVAGRPG